jgi:hypothetical protein
MHSQFLVCKPQDFLEDLNADGRELLELDSTGLRKSKRRNFVLPYHGTY